MVLASLLAGALGLTIGTVVQPKQIGLIFGVVVDADHLPGLRLLPVGRARQSIKWLQIGVLINPIVYMSEGLRAASRPPLATCRSG